MTGPCKDKQQTIEISSIEFLLSLNAAFGQTNTYIAISRIYCEGEIYKPLTLLPQSCDVLIR
jgi:hypothetical protein